MIRRGLNQFEHTLNLNLFRQHFNYIHNFNKYANIFQCKNTSCQALFQNSYELRRHSSLQNINRSLSRSLPKSGPRTIFLNRHVAMAVGVQTNVPGFSEFQCSIGELEQIVQQKLEYFEKAFAEAYQLLKRKFSFVYEFLEVMKPFIKVLTSYSKIQFDVKKGNNCMCLVTESLKFLDISNYLPAGTSYSAYHNKDQ
ncbi:uncharacterized protein LOC143453033 [Clavelina lepadiformis]|uniref:uncharacterized protein LOC143453033 n=1 Tax=Clavelina lepadiformis TaxID=159417 RepID=UPI004041F358